MMPMPSTPPLPPADDERTLALLLKAIDSLDAPERTEVLMFLLRRGLGVATTEPALFTSVGSSVQMPGQVGLGSPGQSPDPRPGMLAQLMLAAPLTIPRTAGGGQQTVPVRFSTDSHQRLRAWCGENGFPMAAVVRGLVDQFLDAQA